MSYEEAFKIGSVCDGYVKCTYVELYDFTHGYKFAFQKASVIDHKIVNLDASGVTISYEFPLFTAEYHERKEKDERLVPVRLTNECIDYVLKEIGSRAKPFVLRQKVWRITGTYPAKAAHGNHTYVTYERKQVQYNPETNYNDIDHPEALYNTAGMPTGEYRWYVIETYKEYGEHPLIESIKNNEIFYVKAVAVDWRATDITNVVITDPDGKEVKLDDALEAARKKMENAKALLLASGGTLLF